MVPIKGLAIPCVYYIEHFLDDKSSILFEKLRSTIKWEKTAKINRWVALYGELPNQEEEETSTTTTKSSYRYRDQPSQGLQPWTAELLDIKKKIEEYYLEHNGSPVEFNVCLLNMYETGQQAIGWHADREEIGRTTPIASISLGATRQFLLKHKSNKDDCASFKMTNGSLTIMDNICQHEYLHSVPKESSIKTSRINLTFRCKKLGEHTKGEKMHERRENLNFLTKTPTSGVNFCNNSIDVDSNVFGSNVTIGDVPIITDHHSAWMIKGQLGAEQFIGAEIEETFKQYNGFNVIAKPWGVPGYVFVQFNYQNGSSIGSSSTNEDSLKDVSKMLLSLRCAMFVMKYHDWYTLDDVLQYKQKNEKSDTASTTTTDDVLTTTTTTPVLPISLLIGEDLFLHFKDRLEKNNVIIPSLIPSTEDTKKILFRVTCDRLGTHKFNSMNVEREIGGAMYEYYKSSKPSMLKFQKLIRVDVIGTNIIIGEQIHEKDISRRMVYFYRNRVVLKANMAHIMLRCAGIKEGDTICDPFCGSGTILMEASNWLKGNVQCIGLDVNRSAIFGAEKNVNDMPSLYYPDSCSFHCKDARAMKTIVGDSTLNAVVTNVPWGVQTGKNVDLQAIYEIVLRTAWYCLKPGGRFVMLVLRGLQMMRILRKLSGRYKLLSIQVVRTTNNMPCVIVVEKLSHDVVHETLKHQLYDMSQYVNISPEMYNAVHLETTKDLDMDHDRRNSQRNDDKKEGTGKKRIRKEQTSLSSSSSSKKQKK